MRILITALLFMLLLHSPFMILAQSNPNAAKSREDTQRHLNYRSDIHVRIILNSGQTIKGDLYLCSEDRYEIISKGIVRVIPRSDIREIQFTDTLWSKVKSAAFFPIRIILIPYYLLGFYIFCKRHPGCH